ncbi:MAG: glycosyltransferase [Actinobacteria bacterium]|nr:glycosyltransferase [Actinomycetota bacterium]
MKIIYVTAQVPWGSGETFILPEVQEILRQGHQVTVIPLRPTRVLALGSNAAQVASVSIHLPFLGIRTLSMALAEAIRHPMRTLAVLWHIFQYSGSSRKVLKNLAVLPKGLAIAWLIHRLKVDHIHAHWASTPATAAYIVANLCGLPWSFTAHRWDIGENNMLLEKARSAKFIRAISKDGQAEIQRIIGNVLASKCHVVHMGVDLTHISVSESLASGDIGRQERLFTLACPANMVLIKGHRYLIEACSLLKQRGHSFLCWLFGDGPLEQELRDQVQTAGLESVVRFRGRWAHDDIIKLYREGTVDVVVLPSINTASGEKEGIPVSLMEAMAMGIPVISTPTGGISELLEGGAGILVAEKDALALVNALEILMNDIPAWRAISERGRLKVKEDFNEEKVIRDLFTHMALQEGQRV